MLGTHCGRVVKLPVSKKLHSPFTVLRVYDSSRHVSALLSDSAVASWNDVSERSGICCSQSVVTISTVPSLPFRTSSSSNHSRHPSLQIIASTTTMKVKHALFLSVVLIAALTFAAAIPITALNSPCKSCHIFTPVVKNPMPRPWPVCRNE